MASVALARVSGSVLSVPAPREGIIKNGPRAGEAWRIETVNVLVADQNVTVVQLPRRNDFGELPLSGGNPIKGEIVDFLVEVSVYGSEVQTRVLEDWPADDLASLAA
jgi:hypothetical protein